jgi:hypothetical protein
MTRKTDMPLNEKLRRPQADVIDQRQQQIDPAGWFRKDPDARPDTNRKQPGGSADPADQSEEGPAG